MPKNLKASCEALESPPWGALLGEVVDDILALIWLNNAWVNLLTTYHTGLKVTRRNRRRSRSTSANARTVHRAFGDDPRKIFQISYIADDYNHDTGHVNAADQLRACYSSDFILRRAWWPMFLYILEVALCNNGVTLSKFPSPSIALVAWRMSIINSLVARAKSKSICQRQD